jgi:F0F1-type ATP synthase membrane subunit a
MALMADKNIRVESTQNTQIWSKLVIWGIVIYVGIDVLLAFLRHDYSSLHNAESDYGRGPYFWLMDINFLLRCGLSLALVKAIWTAFPKNNPIKKASYWLIAWAIASGLLAFFADNPYGYPKLKSGSVHLLLAFIVFISSLVGMILLTRRFRGVQTWHNITGLLAGITVLAIVALILMGHAGIRPHTLGGLYERVCLGSVLLWEAVVAIKIISVNNKSSSASRNSTK